MENFIPAVSLNLSTKTTSSDSTSPRLEVKRFYVQDHPAKYLMHQVFLVPKTNLKHKLSSIVKKTNEIIVRLMSVYYFTSNFDQMYLQQQGQVKKQAEKVASPEASTVE